MTSKSASARLNKKKSGTVCRYLFIVSVTSTKTLPMVPATQHNVFITIRTMMFEDDKLISFEVWSEFVGVLFVVEHLATTASEQFMLVLSRFPLEF